MTVHTATHLEVGVLMFWTLILRSTGALNGIAVFSHLKEAGEGKRASVGLDRTF